MTPENQSNIMVIATLLSNFCAHLGLSPARIIHATITSIKHTTKITDITIFVNIHTIYGKAFVGLTDHSHFILIQFHIIGKFVFNFIPQHQFGHVCHSFPPPLSHPFPPPHSSLHQLDQKSSGSQAHKQEVNVF